MGLDLVVGGNPITNSQLRDMLKVVYEDGVYNAKYQLSTLLPLIPKKSWAGGKEYRYSCSYGDGGNVGSNYETLVLNPGTGISNAEWVMKYGYLTTFFNTNMPENLLSKSDRVAYMELLAAKMEGAFSRISRGLATHLYGGSYGILGFVKTAPAAAVAASNNTMVVDAGAAIKMPVGTRFQVMSGGVPNASNIGTAVYTVTKRDDTKITFSASVAGETIANGDSLILYTTVDGDGTVNGFEGFADLCPFWDDRTGTNWENYISQSFRGINRSVEVGSLAGQFVKAASSGDTRLQDAMVSALNKSIRAGGGEAGTRVVMSDVAWDKVGKELGIQKNLWQATDGGTKRQGVTIGLNELATAFGAAFVDRVIRDPYCFEDYAWYFDSNDLTFHDVGNVSRAILPQGELGKHEVESVGNQGFNGKIDSAINIDQLFTAVPGAPGKFGDSMRIATHVFGNFKIGKTASTTCVKLA